jgi:hypothetical protein
MQSDRATVSLGRLAFTISTRSCALATCVIRMCIG